MAILDISWTTFGYRWNHNETLMGFRFHVFAFDFYGTASILSKLVGGQANRSQPRTALALIDLLYQQGLTSIPDLCPLVIPKSVFDCANSAQSSAKVAKS